MSASGPTDRKSWLPGPLSDPEGTRQWAAVYATTALDAFRPRERATFRDVERFCFFIGYSRSGHTLVGTMLNAHPEVVIAHELDAVTFVRHGFRRAQLFPLLVQRDQRFGTQGRTWSGYQYEIPGQFQGRYDTLRVLGDKRARSSVFCRLRSSPHYSTGCAGWSESPSECCTSPAIHSTTSPPKPGATV
jgi:hypothetical protein